MNPKNTIIFSSIFFKYPLTFNMKKFLTTITIFLILVLTSESALAQKNYYFSSIQGKVSKTDSITLPSTNSSRLSVNITGEQSENFKHISTTSGIGENVGNTIIKFRFEPTLEDRGISRAKLEIKRKNKILVEANLRGMGIPALEGENEASMSEILDLLDISTNLGWTTLPNHIRPKLQGEEISSGLFRKASDGVVTITPIARYSPPSMIPFGYYLSSPEGPEMKKIGVLADSENFHEHQTLYPTLASGSTSFDPQDKTFGLYVTSDTHSSFTEDIWNMLKYPDYAAHATRIFPVRNKEGQLVKDSYLICYEEAANGDYQDYVFLVENIEPINPNDSFETLLQQDNLGGWDVFLESTGLNNDLENTFTVEDGILSVVGKELGYIITNKSYTNYHFSLEFKWGEKRWPPREDAKRDSGICYHIPENDENIVWPLSVECQIQEGDVGDFWLLGYNTIEVEGKQNKPQQYSSIVKVRDNELPNGEWNTVEVLSFNGICVHIVNGNNVFLLM